MRVVQYGPSPESTANKKRKEQMRKIVLLAVMVAMAALMLAATPAMAQDRNGDDDFDDFVEEFCEDFDGDGIEDCEEFVEEFCEDFDGDFFCDEDEEDFFFDGFGDFGDGIFQSSDQEAESGDVDQSFDVTNTGDNSNQCVGVQGVANTGNAQNTINLFNLGGEIDDFELDDLESSLLVSPTNTTTCDQEVNQAATAYGGYGGGYYY
jgi:hypothetical protein